MARGITSIIVLPALVLLVVFATVPGVSATGPAPVAASAAPSIAISSPAPGSSLNSSSILVQLAVANFTLNASAIGGADRPGEGHYDLYLDSHRVAVGTSLKEEVTQIVPGTHKLEAVLVENSGAPLQPRANASVGFTVPAGAPALFITSPLAGTSVNSSSPVVTVLATGFVLDHEAIGMPDVAGRGHLAATVDGVKMRETGRGRFPIAGLSSGAHRLVVEIVSNSGKPLSPPVRDIVDLLIAKGAPVLRILSPADQSTVNSTTLQLGLLVGGFVPSAKNGSVLVRIDGRKVASTTASEEIVNRIAAGRHEVAVALVRPDSSTLTPAVEDLVEYDVPPSMPALRVLDPLPGDSVATSSPVVRVEVSDYVLEPPVPGGANSQGRGHLMAWLDGRLVAESSEAEFRLARVKPGAHRLAVTLGNNDHTNRSPLVAEVMEFGVPQGSPYLEIKDPASAEVRINSSALPVEVDTKGTFKIDLSKAGKGNEPGVGHLHAYVDGAMMENLRDSKGEVTRLRPGRHVVELHLGNNDHSNVTPIVGESLIVTVAEGSPYVEISATVKAHVIETEVKVENWNPGGGGKLRYFVDGWPHSVSAEKRLMISNLTKGVHKLRVELANADGSAASPSVVDQLFVETTVNPPRPKQDVEFYFTATIVALGILGATGLMAVHGVPLARARIVEMTEEEEEEMTQRRPVRGVR